MKGARISVGPHGTQLNMGRDGIYYRRQLTRRRRRSAAHLVGWPLFLGLAITWLPSPANFYTTPWDCIHLRTPCARMWPHVEALCARIAWQGFDILHQILDPEAPELPPVNGRTA